MIVVPSISTFWEKGRRTFLQEWPDFSGIGTITRPWAVKHVHVFPQLCSGRNAYQRMSRWPRHQGWCQASFIMIAIILLLNISWIINEISQSVLNTVYYRYDHSWCQFILNFLGITIGLNTCCHLQVGWIEHPTSIQRVYSGLFCRPVKNIILSIIHQKALWRHQPTTYTHVVITRQF